MQSISSSSSQTSSGQLLRDGVPSACSPVLKLTPTLDPGTVHFINHTFRSSLTHPICLTAQLTAPTCIGSNAIFSVAYIPTFDPTDPLARYAADMGDSPAPTRSYSFAPGAGAFFAIVVHGIAASSNCNYTLTVTSDGPWADAPPSIGGTPAVGAVITGTDATWKTMPAAPAVQPRWRRCDATGANCTDIPGATGASYTVSDADIGSTLRFRNDATDADGTSTSDSAFVEPFIPFETRGAESLTPGDRAHSGFFVRNGVESRCGVPTSAPTTLQPANSFLYDVFSVRSILNEPVCLVARTTPMCGNGVTPSIYNPAFAPASGLATNYAGNSGNGFNLQGVVSSTLPPAENREVIVSQGSSSGTCAQYALTLGADAPFATDRPALSGNPVEGGTLTASDGAWSGTPAISRSWRRCDANGAGCVPIPGAAGASYTPTAADVGTRLRARVTATQGRSVSSDSAATEAIGAAPVDRTAPTGTVRLASRNLKRALRSGRIPVRVTSDESCSAVIQLTIAKKLARRLNLKRVRIARVVGAVPAGRAATLRAKLTRAARRALRGRRSLKLRIAAVLTDPAGNSSTLARNSALRRPRR